MSEKLILKNTDGQVIRVAPSPKKWLYVVYRTDVKRLDLCSDLEAFSSEHLVLIQKVDKDKLKSGLLLETGHELRLISDSPKDIFLNPKLDLNFNNVSTLTGGAVFGLGGVLSLAFVLLHGENTEKREVQSIQTVKIIKPPVKIQRPKEVKVGSRQLSLDPASQKKPKPKVVKKSLKRMGALSALGKLSNPKNREISGLNLNATPSYSKSETSNLPSVRAGKQSAIYSKGIISVAVGAHQEIKGGGGYRVKDDKIQRGVSGSGDLVLAGSAGEADLSEVEGLSLAGGGFDPQLIDIEVRKKSGSIRECYDTALQRNPNVKGLFSAILLISNNGVIESSRHIASDVKDVSLTNCIVKVLNQIKLDMYSANESKIQVNYAFDLRAL